MFKINKTPRFNRDVTFKTPDENGEAEHSLTVRFKLLTSTEAEEHDLNTGEGTVSFLTAAVERIDGVVGDDDEPLPYSAELLAQVLTNYAARIAILNAYLKAAVEGRLGN